MPERAHLAIGSNLNERRTYLESGLAAISALPVTSLAVVSHIYETPPLGPVAQPDFLNAVCAIDTLLPPQELLAAMLNIENNYLRQRRIHWGPRTLDLDLLLYGDRIIASDTLVLPHPQMNDRNFVLVPLCEIESGLIHPITSIPFSTYLADLANAGEARLVGPLTLPSAQHV